MRLLLTVTFAWIFTCAGAICPAHASSAKEDLNRLAIQSDEIYIETMKLCQSDPAKGGDSVMSSSFFSQVAVDSGQQTASVLLGDLDELALLMVDEGWSRTYRNLIEYAPFQQALRDCYPGHEDRQNYFVNRLFVAELLGKAGGVAAGGTAIYSGYRLFRWLNYVAPRFSKWTMRVTVGGAVLYYLDILRRHYIGPVTEGEKESHEEMLNLLRNRFNREVDNIAEENLALYDITIRELESSAALLPPTDLRRKTLDEQITQLKQHREKMAAQQAIRRTGTGG